MNSIIEFLSGKKTYAIAALAIAGGIAVHYGVVIPDWVWLVLGGAGLASVRAAVQKVDAALDEAEEE